MVNHKNNLQLEISKDTVIYIAAPARVATGGPELLHQLAYHLRVDLGLNAFMYYYPSDVDDPIHPEYRSYDNTYTREIVDKQTNILIVPEVVSGIKLLSRFANIQKVIWWLSVDNFFISYILLKRLRYPRITFLRMINKLAKTLLGYPIVDIPEAILNMVISNKSIILKIFKELAIDQVRLHLCQSYYAEDFLKSLSIINRAYLSDYLNREFLTARFNPELKENIVAFNPKKGASFTRKIIAAAPDDITFVPIVNMTRREVIQLLKKSKVYIDFGNHPGKDRLPREAAILGCCVIVGKKGSAANPYDVPIPERYKFTVSRSNIRRIVETIRYCIDNYNEVYHDFEAYRENIRQEPQKFIEDLSAIFTKGR